LDNPILDTLINGIRTRGGNQLITKKGSVRSVLRLLAQGEVVVLLIDQNLAWYDGVFVPFFKEIACTNKALAVLALRTGAPVIPVYNVRQPDGSYQVVFEPEVALVRSGDTTRDIEDNTANFNRVIESYVRRYPEQWFWVHQRWKTRPYQPWPREK
jgi:KDO2-lipid IV(A) lauroyltransferase